VVRGVLGPGPGSLPGGSGEKPGFSAVSRCLGVSDPAANTALLDERLDALYDLIPGLVGNAGFLATYRQSRLLSSGSPKKGKPEEKTEADKVTEG
jgi:hypothetical protein